MDNERELRALLGTNIKRYRTQLGLSQLNFALDMEISPTFLCAVENGKKWVSPQTLIKLAKILNVEIHELFKPNEQLPEDSTQAMLRCLDDAAVTVKRTVEHSINQAFKNIKEQYDG